MRLSWLLLALIPASLGAQVSRDSIITTTATRTSRVVPDRATLYVAVDASAELAVDAVARVEAKSKAVWDALRAVAPRIEMEAPMTLSVGSAADRNGFPGPTTPPSTVARVVIRVHISGNGRVAHAVAAALDAGASSTSTVLFESSVADSVRRARQGEALADARRDAEALARALGGRLGALVDVSTSSNQNPFMSQQPLMLDGRFSQPTVAPDVTVSASVTVRYRLVR